METSVLQAPSKSTILEVDAREALRKFLRQELSHLDAVIRFNIERRKKLERELRDLEEERWR